jgi:hypothetical protein
MASKPALIAQALLDELGIEGIPNLRAVANILNVGIEEADVESFDGALIRVKGSTEGLIAVRKTIRELGKKNFTIAHELGHLLLPGHDESTVCLAGEVETWESGLPKRELEANEFAGELLVPTKPLVKLLSGNAPSFDLIESLANMFSTSLTATAYRFVEATTHACAVVWSERGAPKWFVRSDEFTHWIRLRERLDARTLGADCFGGRSAVPHTQEKVAATAWLSEAVPEDAQILEHTRCVPSYSGALSLLWLPRPLSSDASEDDTLSELNPANFGLHRKTWPGKRR